MLFKYMVSTAIIAGFITQSAPVLAECANVSAAVRSDGVIPLDVWYTNCNSERKKRSLDDFIKQEEALVGSNVVIGFFDTPNSNYITEGGSIIHSGTNIFGCSGGLTSTRCKREQ